jgi:hypothetical protein
VDLVAAVVADEQSLELVQPGEGALDDPAGAAEAGAVFGLAAGYLRCDPAFAELVAVRGVVVASVCGQSLGPPSRPADTSANRRHPIDERDQLCDVVAVTAGDRPGERDPVRVD